MWGAKPKLDEYRKCMANCARLQVIAASDERDRRATDDEIEEILSQVRSTQPVAEWLYFSIATAMRVGEVGALRWSDLSKDGMSIIIRQRKHPRKKRDEVVPLVPEARDIIARQPQCLKNPDLIFPHKHRSITSAFRAARDRTGIKDLRWHDLRHEAISRLFEMGFDSMVVAKFSGHRDINMLRRYTHIDAAKVLKMLEERQAALNV
jgi:integrase